jgi:serine/threonine-protein kinase
MLKGRYEIRADFLKSGCGGRVCAGWDHRLSETVAIKEPALSLPDWNDALRREATVLWTVRHARVVPLLNFERGEDGTDFLVMEFLQEKTLRELLNERRRLRPSTAAALAAQALEGLAAVHRLDVVHRDLKPTNLILTEEGLKIIDFGLVLDLRATRGSRRLTSPGCVMGTPNYLSTEQCRGRADLDARADLYACGVILYEMLVGSPPFDAQMSCDVLQAHLGKPTPPFAEAAPRIRIPPALERVVMTSLEKDRRRRFRSAEEMRAALLDLKR